jgi:hypothetical protein
MYISYYLPGPAGLRPLRPFRDFVGDVAIGIVEGLRDEADGTRVIEPVPDIAKAKSQQSIR